MIRVLRDYVNDLRFESLLSESKRSKRLGIEWNKKEWNKRHADYFEKVIEKMLVGNYHVESKGDKSVKY